MSLQKIRGQKVGGYLPERDIFSGVYSMSQLIFCGTNCGGLCPEAT